MEIKTKFKIGDKVFRIEQHTERAIIECDICLNTHKVEIKGAVFPCPVCKSEGKVGYFTRWFQSEVASTIGKIIVEVMLGTTHTSNYPDEDCITYDGYHIKETYMIAATGIGSGSLWPHDQLFATKEEAMTAAEIKNNYIIAKEAQHPK